MNQIDTFTFEDSGLHFLSDMKVEYILILRINATTEKTIWTPEIGFQYLHDDEKITFRSLLMQKVNTQEISENIDQLYSFKFYDGRQNSLKLEIFYKMSFLCHFKILSYEYPFGQDDCSLDIYFKDNNNLLVAFHVYELG